MGKLLLAGNEYDFEDRLLFHLKFVIGQKFKKQECFFLSWEVQRASGPTLVSVWLPSEGLRCQRWRTPRRAVRHARTRNRPRIAPKDSRPTTDSHLSDP